MVALADGSDMGGSLRNPAAYCNVVGLRPAPGRVPDWPNMLPWQTLAVNGPMGRTVQDVALMLSVLAGPDDRCPNSLTEPGDRFVTPLLRDFAGVKVAWSRTLGGLPVQPEITDALGQQRVGPARPGLQGGRNRA
jgi:amidase